MRDSTRYLLDSAESRFWSGFFTPLGGSCNFLRVKIHKSLDLSGVESTKQEGLRDVTMFNNDKGSLALNLPGQGPRSNYFSYGIYYMEVYLLLSIFFHVSGLLVRWFLVCLLTYVD